MALNSLQPQQANSSPFNRSVQHDAKRAAILSQAARLFNSQGARSTTLKDIADSLGLTKTSLYNYVNTKEELTYQCYMAALEQHHRSLDELEREQQTALARLSGFYLQQYDNWLAARAGRGGYCAALLEIASLKGKHREAVEALYLSMFKRIRGYLRAGTADGSLRECETTSVARGFFGAIPWTFSWLEDLSDEEVRLAARSALDVLLHGIAVAPAHYIFADVAGSDETVPAKTTPPGQLKQESFYRTANWYFNRQGFNGTSLDQIAHHLDLSKGAFYYHISNKEDLLFNCHVYSLDIIDAIHAEAAALESSNGAEKIERVLRRIFYIQNSNQGPLIRYRTLTALPPARRKKIVARRAVSNHRFGEFLQLGINDGSLQVQSLFVAENLLSGVLNAAMDMQVWRKIGNIDAAAIDYFDLIFNGLLPRQVAGTAKINPA